MTAIQIQFTIFGKIHDGIFQAVSGGGAAIWHLMVDGFYYGRLRVAGGVWVFDTNKRSWGMDILAAWFGIMLELKKTSN